MLGFCDYISFQLLLPAISYVIVFSSLEHKELRFIMPSLTLFNIAGAYGLSKIFSRLSKNHSTNLKLMNFAILLLAGSFVFSLISNLASYYNYPGGQAIHYFNQ